MIIHTASILLLCITTTLALVYLPNKNRVDVGRLFSDLILVLAIIHIPLFFFFVSAVVAPDWKGAASWGAFDMFLVSKVFLTPLVLWAVAALYTVEVIRPKNPDNNGILIGLLSGAIIANICLIYILIILVSNVSNITQFFISISILLIMPGYVATWYTLRFWSLFKVSKLHKKALILKTTLLQIPFWIYSIYAANEAYLSLREDAPDCFVATSSAQGYRFIIGKPVPYQRNDYSRSVSQQMINFWAFENLWAAKHPRSHRSFRRHYNVFGRKLSTYIRHKAVASLMYILLKPFEWIALLIVATNCKLSQSHPSYRNSTKKTNI